MTELLLGKAANSWARGPTSDTENAVVGLGVLRLPRQVAYSRTLTDRLLPLVRRQDKRKFSPGSALGKTADRGRLPEKTLVHSGRRVPYCRGLISAAQWCQPQQCSTILSKRLT